MNIYYKNEFFYKKNKINQIYLIMSKKDEQLARMRGLMTYGISETSKSKSVNESLEGPDGKIYAIIREGAKFYIKSAPKGSKLVTESFDYIGGFMNKRNNEYSSYNQASKNLELKLRSLNESYGIKKTVEILNPDKKEELVVEMTDSMKQSLARYRQIMNNAANIMNESSTISMNNTGNPEAPKTTSFSAKIGEPFNNTATAILDKDLKQTANDPEKQSEPFGETEKTEGYKDAQYVPKGSVANQKPSGGKVVRVNENSDFEETIEECDEWGSCGLPSKEGVGEVGDDDPFIEPVNENEQLSDLPDEVTLDEDAESFVGFADDDNEMDESEEDEDLNLDDIDLDLDSDEEDFEDDEIDEIDSNEEDFEDDEIDSDEESEIESLRSEIKELRKLVDSLLNDNEDENEFELDFEDDDNEDEDLENDSDSLNESINLKESFKLNPKLLYRLKEPRDAYGFTVILRKMMAEYGGNEKDEKIILTINDILKEVLKLDYEMLESKNNNNLDKNFWDEAVTSMDEKIIDIFELTGKLSFAREDDELIDSRLDRISRILDSHVEFYNDNIEHNNDFYRDNSNQDNASETNVNVDVDDDFDDDTDEIDQDNIEFDYDDIGNYDEDDMINNSDEMFGESIRHKRLNEEGVKLNVFGKHPGYRKKVMTLPQTGSDKEKNYYDWNDESVYSEEPFGSKIGKSTPFDNVVDSTIMSVLENIKKKN